MILIDGKPQVQQFELSVVSVQQIPSSSTVLPSTPHVLAQPMQRRTFLCISLRIVSIGLAYIRLERGDPVNFVGLLERTGDHRRLRDRHGRREIFGLAISG